MPLTKIDSPHALHRTIFHEARSGVDHAVIESEMRNPDTADITALARYCQNIAFQSLDQVVYCVVGKKIWIFVTGEYKPDYRARLLENNEAPHMKLPVRRHVEKRRITYAEAGLEPV